MFLVGSSIRALDGAHSLFREYALLGTFERVLFCQFLHKLYFVIFSPYIIVNDVHIPVKFVVLDFSTDPWISRTRSMIFLQVI